MAIERAQVSASDRKVWRTWLKKNHRKASGAWLIIYRKDSGIPSVHYNDAVEEALCFGWIDSKGNKRDDKSYLLSFAPRKSKSAWSKLNKERIKRLIRQKLMTASGLEKITAAKKNGSWSLLDASDQFIMPADLQKRFARSKIALRHFEAFPPSTKRGIYFWIESAKTDLTRTKRVEETVTLAAKNIRANQWKKA